MIGNGEEEEIPADVVVIAKGMRPNVDLAKEAGIEIGETGGIITDGSMHVKKGDYLKNVYALGDCVEVIDAITHHPRLSQLASTAALQARIVMDNILGIRDSPYDSFDPCLSPTVAAISDLQVGSAGIMSETAWRHGMKIIEGKASKYTKVRFDPEKEPITVKLLFEADSEKLVGAQIVAGETVADRINDLCIAIKKGETAKELCKRERCYDPTLSMLKDVIVDAAENALERRISSLQ